jgi:hypothetical protein
MVYDYERCRMTFHSPFRSLRKTFALKCGCETYPSSRKTFTELRLELGVNGSLRRIMWRFGYPIELWATAVRQHYENGNARNK